MNNVKEGTINYAPRDLYCRLKSASASASASEAASEAESSNTERMTRAVVLERMVLEVIELGLYQQKDKCPNWESYIENLRLVLRQQCIGGVEIAGSSNGEFLFSLTMMIDWDKHRILVAGKPFLAVSHDKSVAQQVEEAATEIVSLIQQKASDSCFDRLKMFYYTDDDEMSEKLKMVSGNKGARKEELTILQQFSRRATTVLIIPGQLEELNILLRCIPPSAS